MITITRSKIYAMTVVAVALYVLLAIVFADDYFTSDFWNSEAWSDSSLVSWLLLVAIGVAGFLQASRIPEDGVAIELNATTGNGQIDDPKWWKLILGNVHFAVLWLPLRFFVGHSWLSAGEHKLRDDGWMDGGQSLLGFWERAAAVPDAPARPAITYDWFRRFLQYMIDNEWYTWFAKVIAVGEFLVGLGLIFGALVGLAAFFGTVLNFNFLLAGTASTNPVLFGLGIFIVLGWKVAGYLGIDGVLLPFFGIRSKPSPVIAPDRAASPGLPKA